MLNPGNGSLIAWITIGLSLLYNEMTMLFNILTYNELDQSLPACLRARIIYPLTLSMADVRLK
jgi:hypothetical protein